MKSKHSHLAFVGPFPDETLMSFIGRIAVDMHIRVSDLLREVNGANVGSARYGERKSFNWEVLSAMVGISPELLFKMSERSFVVSECDRSRLTWQHFHAVPWAKTRGYPCYSPAALARSDHLRLSWLRPGVFIDSQTRSLFLRHCHECHVELAQCRWKVAGTNCPICGAALGSAPVVEAPQRVAEFFVNLAGKVEREYRARPLRSSSPVLTQCAANWHVVELLRKDELGMYTQLIAHLFREVGLLPITHDVGCTSLDVVTESLRQAQLWMIADHACKKYPEVLRRFDLMRRFPSNLCNAEAGMIHGLRDLQYRLGLR